MIEQLNLDPELVYIGRFQECYFVAFDHSATIFMKPGDDYYNFTQMLDLASVMASGLTEGRVICVLESLQPMMGRSFVPATTTGVNYLIEHYHESNNGTPTEPTGE